MKHTTRTTYVEARLNRRDVGQFLVELSLWLRRAGRAPLSLTDAFRARPGFEMVEVTVPVENSTKADDDSLHAALVSMRLSRFAHLALRVEEVTTEPGQRPVYVATDGAALPLGLPGFADPVSIARACLRSGYSAGAAGFAAI